MPIVAVPASTLMFSGPGTLPTVATTGSPFAAIAAFPASDGAYVVTSDTGGNQQQATTPPPTSSNALSRFGMVIRASAWNTSSFIFTSPNGVFQISVSGGANQIVVYRAGSGTPVATINNITLPNDTNIAFMGVVTAGTSGNALFGAVICRLDTGQYVQPGGGFGTSPSVLFNYQDNAPPASGPLNVYTYGGPNNVFKYELIRYCGAGSPSISPAGPTTLQPGGTQDYTLDGFSGALASLAASSGTLNGGTLTAPSSGSGNVIATGLGVSSESAVSAFSVAAQPVTTSTYTATLPSTCVVGQPVAVVVTPNGGNLTGLVAVSASGDGATTAVTTLTFSGTSASQSVSFTPTSAGTLTVTLAPSSGITGPTSLTSVASVSLLKDVIYLLGAANASYAGKPTVLTYDGATFSQASATDQLLGAGTFHAVVSLPASQACVVLWPADLANGILGLSEQFDVAGASSGTGLPATELKVLTDMAAGVTMALAAAPPTGWTGGVFSASVAWANFFVGQFFRVIPPSITSMFAAAVPAALANAPVGSVANLTPTAIGTCTVTAQAISGGLVTGVTVSGLPAPGGTYNKGSHFFKPEAGTFSGVKRGISGHTSTGTGSGKLDTLTFADPYPAAIGLVGASIL